MDWLKACFDQAIEAGIRGELLVRRYFMKPEVNDVLIMHGIYDGLNCSSC